MNPMNHAKQPWENYRVYDLIATYEELFAVGDSLKTMYWFGNYGRHVLKYNVSQEQISEAYQEALTALGKTHEGFQNNDRYVYRGNIVVDMCRHNNIPIPEYIRQQMPQETLDFTPGGM